MTPDQAQASAAHRPKGCLPAVSGVLQFREKVEHVGHTVTHPAALPAMNIISQLQIVLHGHCPEQLRRSGTSEQSHLCAVFNVQKIKSMTVEFEMTCRGDQPTAAFSSVVLPAPLAPMIVAIVPGETSMLAPCTAAILPNSPARRALSE